MEKDSRVMYIVVVPSSSHLNPTLCFVNTLLKKFEEMKIDKLIVYTEPQFYQRILNLPENLSKDYIECRNLGLSENAGTSNLLDIIMNFENEICLHTSTASFAYLAIIQIHLTNLVFKWLKPG